MRVLRATCSTSVQTRCVNSNSITFYVKHFFLNRSFLQAEPTFQYFDQFILEVLHKVFATDALESSRPLNAEVNDLDDIEQVFDTISYDKGELKSLS